MTNKPDLTAGANAAKATTRTAKGTSTRTKDDLDNNPVIQAIREIGIQTLAKTFQKTPAAIHSWVANRRIPWPDLARVSDMTTVPLTLLMDANSEAPKQEFRGKTRPHGLLVDLAHAEVIDDDLLTHLAEKYNAEKRILKTIAGDRDYDPKKFKMEYDALSHVNQQWANKAEVRAAKVKAGLLMGVHEHEVTRRLRVLSFTPTPTLAAQEREARKARAREQRQRFPLAIRAYIRGMPVDEAAIAGHTSADYLYREARKIMDLFGESLRNLRSFPTYIRYALAEDFHAIYEGRTTYASPLLVLYRKTPQTRPRPYAPHLEGLVRRPTPGRDRISVHH